MKKFRVIFSTFCVCFFFNVAAAQDSEGPSVSSIEFIRSIALRHWDSLVTTQKPELKFKINAREQEEFIFGTSFIGELLLLPVQRSKCGAWDSCILRCGDSLLGAPYTCSCDPICIEFDDCCVDFQYYCGAPQNSTGLDTFLPDNTNENVPSVKDVSSNLHCLQLSQFDTSSYGFWYDNGLETSRKCIVKKPHWCETGNYDQFEWDFTQSLSLLLNFGPDGWNNDLLFSSDNYDPLRCPNVWEIWDPFTSVCRQISCNPEYTLENGKCVWDGNGPKPRANEEFLRLHTKMANITLYGTVLGNDSSTIAKLNADMVDSMSKRIRINSTRFSNIVIDNAENTFKAIEPRWATAGLHNGDQEDPVWISTEEGISVVVNFTLAAIDNKTKETHELTIEQLLSVFSEAVTYRAVLLTNEVLSNDLNNSLPMKINGVNECVETEEIDFFKKWCRGGDLDTYWNEAFEVLFVLKNKTDGMKLEMEIHVKDTNKTYEEGHFIANLLYQSWDMNATAANFSGVVIVCENRPQLFSDSCPRITLNDTEFIMQEDGSLIYTGDVPGVGPKLDRFEYEFMTTGEVLTCVDYEEAKKEQELTFLEKLASGITMSYCLIHLCIGEFIFFFLFILGVRRSTAEKDIGCTIVAAVLHFSSLTFFAWSSVISYDLFQTFAKFQPVTRSQQKYLWRYTIAGYGIPFLIVFTSLMVDFSSNIDIDYGTFGVCWIGNSMAALYIFALPIAISVLVNLFFFLLTVRGIKKVSKVCASTNLRQKNRVRFSLYVKMSSVQCFSWIFGFLTVLTHFNDLTSRIFEFIFLTSSSLQGLYIFFAFVTNKRVFSLYKSFWSGREYDSDQSSTGSQRSTIKTTIRRNSTRNENIDVDKPKTIKTMSNGHRVVSRTDTEFTGQHNHNPVAERTISNETCLSFVPND